MGMLPWDEEEDAATILSSLLGGTSERRDPGGGPVPMHDLDLHLKDGRTISVEVTRHNATGYLSQRGAVESKDWTTPELAHNWHVGMAQTFNVNTLHASVVAPLRDLEVAGINRVILRSPLEGPAEHARRMLHDLGVRIAYQLGAATNGRSIVDVGDASVGGSTSFAAVAAVATEHASKSDNRIKLSNAASADERHLFIWVESSAHQVTAAMDMEARWDAPPYGAVPNLPEMVDRVWLATAYRRPGVWSYQRNSGWEHFSSFDLGR